MSVSTFTNGIAIVSIPVTIASTPTNVAFLPWGGVNGVTAANRFYKWTVTLAVTSQHQSSPTTRQQLQYNGQDINVGMWIANLGTGLAYQIVSIASKTTSTVTCTVQDVSRYNTYRATTQNGIATPTTGSYVVFELAADGTPMIDPAPAGVGTNFFTTLVSRFVYDSQEQYDFPLSQPGGGVVSFTVGEVLAIDEPTQTFVLADATHTATTVGQITSIDDTGTVFTINPVGKVVDNFNFLPGVVGQFLYTNTASPGNLTTTPGGAQVYLTIRQWTASTTVSSTFGSASTNVPGVSAGNTFNVNGVLATVGGVGSLTNIVSAVNAITGSTGVSAAIAGSFFIQFTAVDARQIGFKDVTGSVTTAAGLISVENGVKGAVIVATSSASVGGVTSIIAGTGISVNQATGAVTVTNTDAPPVGFTTAFGKVFVQSTAQTTWTITHNAGTTNIAVQVYDNFSGVNAAGNVILPDEVTIIDINTTQITFADAQSGTALLTVFG